MAETDNPDVPLVPPRAMRFGEDKEGREGKVARRERGQSGSRSGPPRLVQFLHDVRAEMKRVSWPTLKHVQNTTIITLIAVIFFAVYLFAVDNALYYLINGLEWAVEKVARFLGLA